MTDVPPATSVRMIFEFTAGGVRLLEQHPVKSPLGPSGGQHPGDHVEVRDRDGQTVTRVPVSTGLGSTVETFPEDPYISADGPRVLTVVVPAPPEADHVAIVRVSGAGIEVLGTFRLRR